MSKILVKYKLFLENKNMDEEFHSMFNRMELNQFEYFFNGIKGTKDENIIYEVKYRITDGEEPYGVLVDVIDNKLDPSNNKAQFDGRALAMSLFFDKKEGGDLDGYTKVLTILGEYMRDGIDKLKNKFKDLRVLESPLKKLRERLKLNQDVMSWAHRKEVSINNETINSIDELLSQIN